MSKDTFILKKRKKEKMDELTKLAYEEDGHKRGLEQGFVDGVKHGKMDAIIEVAKSLLKENISLDVISKCTGLSPEKIEKIKEEI